MSRFKDFRDDVATFPSRRIEVPTIGEGWIAIGTLIMESGVEGSYDARAIREVILPILVVTQPSSDDEVVRRHADARP
jgi:hypothetical protein